jgi:GNAT superfamily N-acetyltransferase
LTVRLATTTDLPGVLALYRQLRPNDPELSKSETKAAFDRVLSDKSLGLVVCEQENVLAATCMLAVIQNLANGARPFGVIEHVVTLPQFRQRGLAHKVLRYALDLAWSKRCYKVMLLSGAHRAEAHRLYESAGFDGDVERGYVAKPSM